MQKAKLDTFDAAVTGLGITSAAGIGAQANWAKVCAGESMAVHDPALHGLPTDFSCRVPDFDPADILGKKTARKLDRFIQLALVAAREALADAGWDPQRWDGTRVGIVVGNSLGGTETFEAEHRALIDNGPRAISPMTIPKGMNNMAAGMLAIDCHAHGPALVAANACASGTTAIGMGRDLLRSGQCDIVIAGGAESALSPSAMAALARMGATAQCDDPGAASRPFDVDRHGFVAGEGAGFLVLERVQAARDRGARIRGHISGYGAATDAVHPTAPDPDGKGIERSLIAALDDADVLPTWVDHVNAHGTSTPLNDVTEAAALQRTLGDTATVTSTKGVTGHTLGAAGAIEAIYAVLATETATAPPTANLTDLDPEIHLDIVHARPRVAPIEVAISTSLGFGGHNAALVITAA